MTTKPEAPFEVLSIKDTRDFIEVDDRWVAVPGSGDARECDRCGRVHEIHAHVRDAAGSEWTVGVGCMNATTTEARKLASKATRGAKAAAKAAAKAELAAQYVAATAEAAALVFPVEELVKIDSGYPSGGVWWRVGVEQVLVGQHADEAERLATLEDFWRERHVKDRFGKLYYRARQAAFDAGSAS